MSLDRLLAENACRDLVLAAAACTDAHDPEGFAALFADVCELVRPGMALLRGREAIAESYRARPASRITRHVVTNTRITLRSPTEARGRSLVLLWSGLASDPAGSFGRPAQGREVLGEFDDDFVLTAAGWCIARREARFVLFNDVAG